MMKFGRRPGFPSRGMFGPMPAGHAAADVTEDILEFLGDGELHELREIANAVDLSEEDVEKALDFLMKVGLVEKGVRITDSGSNFLKLPVGLPAGKHRAEASPKSSSSYPSGFCTY